MNNRRINVNEGPIWLFGILIVIVVLFLFLRTDHVPDRSALKNEFVRHAAEHPQQLPVLPEIAGIPDLSLEQARAAAGSAWSRIEDAAGATVAVGESSRLRVEIRELQQTETGELQVIGQVTNISESVIEVPVSAFEFTDSHDALYSSDSDKYAVLAPGESTPLDLAVPLPAGSGLRLTVRLPPDPPLEIVLIESE